MAKNGSNIKDIATYNRLLVRNVIRESGPIARFELARETGLTPPTITAIVNELLKDGIVSEVGYGESSGGRRPVMLELNPQAAYIFAARLQRGEVVAALFDIRGNSYGERQVVLDTTDIEAVVEEIGHSFDILVEGSLIDRESVLYCGVASPGLINTRRGLIKNSSNLKWKDVPLGALLSKRLYGIPVYLENISNAAAFAELQYGSGRGYRNFVYLNLSVGIGAGIIIDDELYGGELGYAGEIGHMPLLPHSEVLCACGKFGCFEALCGTRAVVERLKAVLSSADLEACGSEQSMNVASFFSPTILEREEIQAVFLETAKTIGIVVANLVSIFNPSLIILGGELPLAGPAFVAAVEAEVKNTVLSELVGTVKVVKSAMEDDPPLIGAYALALDVLFSTEKWK